MNEHPLEEGKLTIRLINPCRSILNDPQSRDALHSVWKKEPLLCTNLSMHKAFGAEV